MVNVSVTSHLKSGKCFVQNSDEWGPLLEYTLPSSFWIYSQRVILTISILSATVLPPGCHCLWISASRLTVPFDLGLPFPILEGPPLCIGAWLEEHTNCAGVGQALNF